MFLSCPPIWYFGAKPVWNGVQTISAPLACNFSLVCDFWLCSRQYLWFLSCSRIFLFSPISDMLWDSLRLIQTHSDSLRLIQAHWASLRLIETHGDALRRILRKMTLLARMRLMKSHFLKRFSFAGERLKIVLLQFHF